MAEVTIDPPTARPATPGPRESKPPPARMRRPPAARVAVVQGVYYLAAGLWPVLGLKSFMLATGPKLEGWLAKGVGACMANIGVALAAAGARGKVARELRLLGVGTALSFAAMDFWYAGVRRRISRVYLVNGVVQLGFVAAWGFAAWRENRDAHRLPEAAFA
jgi:hypothetical protein